MSKEGYEKLEIWEKAKQLGVSAISVPSNITEGDKRQTDKESIRFFFIAKRSVAELRTQLCITFELKKIIEQDFKILNQEYRTLAYQIGSIIKARSEEKKQL